MGIVSQDTFARAVEQNANVAMQAAQHVRGLTWEQTNQLARNIRVDRGAALQVYGQIKDYVMRNGWLNGKSLRPWEIDRELYARLDRAQPWWGFEFETGYQSRDARGEVISHVWDTWDNVVFDSEGEGNAAVEITFAPQEMSKYLDGTADGYKFVEYLTGNPRVMNGGREGVGTHINVSHPSLTRENMNRVAGGLAMSVAKLPINCPNGNTRLYMFGRANLYGGFFPMTSGASQWLEGKLFRTTYDIEVFKRFIKVCEGLTKIMGVLCERPAAADGKIAHVTNLYEVCFAQADPVLEWAFHVEVDGTRGNNALNGAHAPDRDASTPQIVEVDLLDEDDDDYHDDDDDDDGMWCEACNEYH